MSACKSRHITSTLGLFVLSMPLASLGIAPDARAAEAAQVEATGTQEAASGETAARLDAVDVSEAANDLRRDSTTAVVSFGRPEIERFGETNLVDLLSRLPGVSVDRAGGAAEVRLQGLGNGYTQILIDGERTPIGFTLDSLSPEVVERIEVLRTATADLGTQAIAGTINIILRDVPAQDVRELVVNVGSENGSPSLSLDGRFARQRDGAAYSIGAGISHEEQDGTTLIRDIGTDAAGTRTLSRTTERDGHLQVKRVNLAPQAQFEPTADDTVSIEGTVLLLDTRARTRDEVDVELGAFPQYSAIDLAARSKTVAANGAVNWSRKIGDYSELDARASLRYNRTTGDVQFDGYDEQGTYIRDRDVDSTAEDTVLGVSGKYVMPYADTHSIDFGWDGDVSLRDEDRIQRDITPTGLPPDDIDEIYDARINRLALFAQQEWQPTDAVSAYAGLRWEGVQTHIDGNVLERASNRSSVFSPIVQGVWKLSEDQTRQLRLGISRTYRAPAIADLVPRRYISNNNSATSPDRQGNPDLGPELAWGIDAAYEHYVGESSMLSASTFYRRIDDVILQELFNADSIWISRPINNGEAEVIGVQLEGRANLSELIDAAPAIDVSANIARNWSRVSEVPGPDNRLNRQVPLTANFELSHAFAATPLSAGISYSYQRGTATRISDTQRVATSVSRGVDLFLNWTVDAKTQLRLSTSNVLHDDNIATAHYFDDLGTLTQVTTTPTYTVVHATLTHQF